MDKPIIRIIPHDESIEVRASHFFYFDENPARRSINKRMIREQAEEIAKKVACFERDKVGKVVTGIKGWLAMKINWKQFGRDLKNAREKSDLSLREASRLFGIHFSNLSRLENGVHECSVGVYLFLCRWMAVDPFNYFAP